VIGHVVGKYKVREQIGEGGMGVVYRAEHLMLASPAAIKILLPQFTTQPQVVERFFTEAKATGQIQHPGIVQIFDYGRLEDQRAYIIMELLRGETLTQFQMRRGVIDPSLAAQIGIQLLSALEAAHVRGVVHRDIKPDNIQLVKDNTAPGSIRVKVLDFGIAKLLGDRRKEVSIVGTPCFMAPEQCRGADEIDARADLYAVGCILFSLLTGRPPFDAESPRDVMAMQIYQPPPRLLDVAPNMPPELDALIAKMLAKDPAERTPSAAWALAALERIALPPLTTEIQLVNFGPTPTPPSRVAEEKSRFPVVVLLVALVLAGIAAALIALL
jgi:serine/threonine-protein kinase